MPSDLMDLETESLIDRVTDLEKRSAEQANEVACLKSALADCLRRLTLVEMNKGMSLCPTNMNKFDTRYRAASNDTRVFQRADPHPNRMGHPKQHSAASAVNLKVPTSQRLRMKSPHHQRLSSSSTALNNYHSSSSSSGHTSVKETVYLPGDGILRFYVRGHPVNVYIPTQLIPTYDLSVPAKAPESSLKLEWVYGYRGRDCRTNLYYLPTGEMIYFVAAVVVLYNIDEQCQRHYLEHTDDVKCLAIHPDRITVATGQVAGHDKQCGKPHVRIWSSVDLKTLRIIGLGDFDRAVCCVAFSKTDNGNRLAVVDESQDHVISIWEWQKSRKLAETKCSCEPVLALEFHSIDDAHLVTCGKNHLGFWTFDGTTLTKKLGVFETGKHSCEKPKYVLCLTFAESGDLLTGDSSGNIISWKRGTNIINQIYHNIHDGGVFSMCLTSNGHLISGGGKDRRLVFFDSVMNPTGQVKELPEFHGGVRTICPGPGNLVLVGTTKNTILQFGIDSEFSCLVHGHSEEFWGLACNAHSHQFLTAGRDRVVILWDSLSKQAIKSKEVVDPVHCAAFYPQSISLAPQSNSVSANGGDSDLLDNSTKLVESHELLVALGTTNGRWMVMSCLNQDVVAAHTDGLGEQIECLSYSPDGNFLAVGSRDNVIYIYNVLERGYRYNRIGRCCGHSSFVTHFDWSIDSRFIRSCSGDYELLYWTASDCKQILSPSALRDIDWSTQTCVLGWEVVGIWPTGADGTDINACSRSPDGNLLAVGDDFGKVRLFTYPAEKPKAACKAYNGHSSHVTNVGFLNAGSRLISTGGKDTAALQWEICA